MTFIEVPEVFVTQTQRMDPLTEDVIRGSELRQGMIVVIEGSLLRQREPGQDEHELTQARYIEMNRWCRVTDLSRRGDIISFVGVYSDGVKISREYAASWFWIVKNESK